MKKMKFTILLVALFMFSQSLAHCQGIDTGLSAGGAASKLLRGFENLAGAVVEIPGTMMRRTKTDGVLTGLSAGMADGIFNTIKRVLTGIWEISTFPVPVPEDYKPVLPAPKYLNLD